MMNKTLILTLGALSFVALSGFHGGCGRSTPERRVVWMERAMHEGLDDALDEIDATEPQRARAHELAKGVAGEAKSLVLGHQAAKEELWTQWSSSKPDSARVHGVIDERLDVLAKVLHRAADAAIELHGMLTPEQRKEVEAEWRR
jgi:Spy/CpxP family protein refolding chaperone